MWFPLRNNPVSGRASDPRRISWLILQIPAYRKDEESLSSGAFNKIIVEWGWLKETRAILK
jgi:hypothetical protein